MIRFGLVAMIARRNMAKKYRQQSNRSLFSSVVPFPFPPRNHPSALSAPSPSSLSFSLAQFVFGTKIISTPVLQTTRHGSIKLSLLPRHRHHPVKKNIRLFTFCEAAELPKPSKDAAEAVLSRPSPYPLLPANINRKQFRKSDKEVPLHRQTDVTSRGLRSLPFVSFPRFFVSSFVCYRLASRRWRKEGKERERKTLLYRH